VQESSVNFDLIRNQRLLIVISGPSGVGKDSVVKALLSSDLPLHFVVTANTRSPRPEEIEGVDYFFISKDKFKKMIRDNELIEWAHVYDNYKGVPKSQVKDAFASGKDVVMRLDVQGAERIRSLFPEAILIFLLPSDEEEWHQRLEKRTDAKDNDFELRIKTVKEELEKIAIFDYLVVNAENKLDEAVETIKDIITAEHHRVDHRKISLE